MTERLLQFAAGVICVIAMVAVVHATPKPLPQQPFPDATEYADGARNLTDGNGYVTTAHGGTRQPPRYPPGFSMALSPFSVAGKFPSNVQRGATAYALLYVLAMVLAGWVLGGPLAAGIVGLIVLSSPFSKLSASLIMSDALVAALSVMMLPLLVRTTRAGERLAGALQGVAMLVRLTSGIGVIALLAASPRTSLKRIVLWSAPFVIGLALLQWAMFGNPLTTGYDYWGVAGHTFSLDNLFGNGVSKEGPFIVKDRLDGHLMNWVCPCPVGGSQAALDNVWFYPVLLLGGFWVFGPPLLPLLGLWYAWRRRAEAVGRYALVLVGLSLLTFVLYRFQGARFLAGPASVLEVLAAVAVADGLRRLAPWLLRRARAAPP